MRKKISRFNGKPDLTGIQIQERARRARERIKMRGLPTPKGTKPREFQATGKPIFKPIMAKPVSSLDLGRLTAILPFLIHRITRKEQRYKYGKSK